jgi:FecR-like protein
MRNHGHPLWQQVLALLLALLLSPFVMFGQGAAPHSAGQITALVPAVSRNSTPAKNKDAVYWNDLLHSEATGRARLSLLDGSILTLGSSTALRVIQHDPNAQQTQLQLDYGRLRSRVVQLSRPGAKFEVKTPNAVAGVIGTDFNIAYIGDRTLLQVYSGIMQLTTRSGQMITVTAGQQVIVNADGSIDGPKPTSPEDQQTSIQETSVDTQAADNGNDKMLKVWLPILGVALTAVIVGITRGHDSNAAQMPPPPPPVTTTATPAKPSSAQHK